VVVLETNDMLKKFIQILDKLPKLKAIVVWGEVELVSELDTRFYLWKDFIRLGEGFND